MAVARRDMDIWWILAVAAAIGIAVWNHQELTAWLSRAWDHRFWLF